MNSTSFLLIGLLTGATITLLFIFFVSPFLKKGARKKDENSASLDQQDFSRNIRTAIHDLTQLCRQNSVKDPSLPSLYLVLGNLHRINGEAHRSVVIHQNLLTETSLPKNMYDRIRLELAKDFFALGITDQALSTLKQISDRSTAFLRAQELLVEIFHGSQEYEKAYEAMAKILRRKKTWKNRKRTGYFLAFSANRLVETGDLVAARRSLKKALDYDRDCVLAYMLLGRISLAEKKFDDAIDYLSQIVRIKPEYSFLAIPKIEDAFYGKQAFMRLGDTIEKLTEQHPDDAYLNFSLGRYLRKKKLFPKARRALQNALDVQHSHILAHEEAIHLNDEMDDMNNTVNNFASLLEEAKAVKGYVCNYCGARQADLNWCCPSCGRWETVVADHHLLNGAHESKPARPSEASRV